jgi:hypothetical protein
MQQGAPFPAVARQFSSLPTAANGGDAGWVSPGEMAPEVEAAVEQMRPGQLSAPIPVKDGVYIIYLREKRAGGTAMLVDLKQAAVSLNEGATAADESAARDKLVALRPQLTACDKMEATAGKTPGVVAADLGEAEVADLAGEFRDAAEKLKVGEVSEPIRTRRPAPGRRLRPPRRRRAVSRQGADRAAAARPAAQHDRAPLHARPAQLGDHRDAVTVRPARPHPRRSGRHRPEIVVKAWRALRRRPAFFVVGDAQAVASARPRRRPCARSLARRGASAFPTRIPVLDLPLRAPVVAGQPTLGAAPRSSSGSRRR